MGPSARSGHGLTAVRQIAAHELVLDQLRRSIENGQFRPGDRLPSERDLAEALDVSRTVVRAAVAVLEREGLVTVRRGRGGGFIVQAPTYDPAAAKRFMKANKVALSDTFDYRVIVEGAAARLAAERRRVREIAELRSLLRQLDVALTASLEDQTPRKVVEFRTLGTKFHLGIARVAHNDALYDAVSDACRNVWTPVGAVFGPLEDNANDRHKDILDAIADGDADLAASTMEAHINETRQNLEAWLKR